MPYPTAAAPYAADPATTPYAPAVPPSGADPAKTPSVGHPAPTKYDAPNPDALPPYTADPAVAPPPAAAYGGAMPHNEGGPAYPSYGPPSAGPP